jgi:hypothetical protein
MFKLVIDKLNVISSVCEKSLFLFFLVLGSCNSEKASDCFQNAGELTRVEVATANFEKITVFENLNLVLKQGEEQKVAIESGEFLLNDISVTVEDNRLIVRNENGCNLFRDYGLSTVYVTSPNINEIRSSTGLNIASEGTLVYPSLRIISESFNQPEADTTSGSFDLNLDCDTVVVLVNGISFLQLSGQTQNFNINAAAGASRIEAGELRAEMVRINHRGSNDIIVNPQQSISGIIRGYGDVVSLNRPQEIEVEETFEGRLIFRN